MVYITTASGKLICNECDKEFEFEFGMKISYTFQPMSFIESLQRDAIKSNKEAYHHAHTDDCKGMVVLSEIYSMEGSVACDEIKCRNKEDYKIENITSGFESELSLDTIYRAICSELPKMEQNIKPITDIKWSGDTSYCQCSSCGLNALIESYNEMKRDESERG